MPSSSDNGGDASRKASPISRLLKRAAEKFRSPPKKTPEPRTPAPSFDSPNYWNDIATLALENIAQTGNTRASGRVQIISLADFRAAVGPLWEQYKDRILLIADTTIGRMIGKGRTYLPMPPEPDMPQDPDSWMLLMPDLDPLEAAEHADEIAAALGEKLVGEKFSMDDPPTPRAATLNLNDVIKGDGSIDLSALKSAVSRARQIRAGAVHANMPAKSSAASTPAQSSNRFKIALRPGWNPSTGTEDAFFLRPIAPNGDDLVLNQRQGIPEAIALRMCTVAGQAAQKANAARMLAKITLPIPYGMLFKPIGGKLREAITDIPQQARLMHIRLEIVHTPASAYTSQLATLRELFRGSVRDVAFLVDPFAEAREIYALTHTMFGCDFSAVPHWTESDLLTAIMRLRQGATGNDTYILGLRTPEQIKIVADGGITEVGGTPISVDLEGFPERLRHIPRDAIFTP